MHSSATKCNISVLFQYFFQSSPNPQGTRGCVARKGGGHLQLSDEHDFLLVPSQPKLMDPHECVWLGPLPSWLFSAPMGPAWVSPSLTQAKVMVSVTVATTGQEQPYLIHFRSSGPSTDLALKKYLIRDE